MKSDTKKKTHGMKKVITQLTVMSGHAKNIICIVQSCVQECFVDEFM